MKSALPIQGYLFIIVLTFFLRRGGVGHPPGFCKRSRVHKGIRSAKMEKKVTLIRKTGYNTHE
jgi:hypothetical protein